MANFDILAVSGFDVRAWVDPKVVHRNIASHLYRRVIPPALPAVAQVVLHAIVDGVEAPLDGALGGNLFAAARLQWSGFFPFPIVQTPGQSSEITLTFTAKMLGHQELVIRRPGGGAIILGFEVEL